MAEEISAHQGTVMSGKDELCAFLIDMRTLEQFDDLASKGMDTALQLVEDQAAP